MLPPYGMTDTASWTQMHHNRKALEGETVVHQKQLHCVTKLGQGEG